MIYPHIVGRGMAGNAIAKCFGILAASNPQWEIQPARWLERGESPKPEANGTSILCIANPHALHAPLIVEAEKAGYQWMVCEKPGAVSLEQVESLKNIQSTVVICHGYRQQWGPLQIRQIVKSGELGDLISIEGRYWQSSAAERAVAHKPKAATWKDDTSLNGPHDVLFDLATHWGDLMQYLVGETIERTEIWASYKNAISPHRDTHIQLALNFPSCRTWGSISKTVHGAQSGLEFTILGTRRSVHWNFSNPDVISIGEGTTQSHVLRNDKAEASDLPAVHAMGWLEGYLNIIHQTLKSIESGTSPQVPTLQDSCRLMSALLSVETRRF